MKKGIILYQSKYGATRKYAGWLKETAHFDCMETKEADIRQIKGYDIIILGGGIYASGIAGISFLKKNFQHLKNKKLAVFCVGASPYDEKAFQEIRSHNLPGDFMHIPCFYCRGAWDEKALSFKDRALCKMLKRAIAGQAPSTYAPWQNAFMEASRQDKCDWTDKKYLEPLIAYIDSEYSESS